MESTNSVNKFYRKNLLIITISIFVILFINKIALCDVTTLPQTVVVKIAKPENMSQTIMINLTSTSGITVDKTKYPEYILVTMPFEEYIKGVVFAEMGTYYYKQEAIKAQAIAARCFVSTYVMDVLKGAGFNLRDGTSASHDVIGYKPFVSGAVGWTNAMGTSISNYVNATAGELIKSYNRKTSQNEIIIAKFGKEFGSHSEDSTDIDPLPTRWYQPPYLKWRTDNGGARTLGLPPGNSMGLCQLGAVRREESGWNDYKKILKYYYGTNPAIIYRVKLYQGTGSNKTLKYESKWEKVTATPTPSIYGELIQRNLVVVKNEPFVPGNITVEILACENVDVNTNLQVKFGKTSPYTEFAFNGNWLPYSSSRQDPKWEGTANIPDINANYADYTLSIEGKNVNIKLYKNATMIDSSFSGQLDKNPATVAKPLLSTGDFDSKYEPGADNTHYKFKIEKVIVVPPTDGFLKFEGNSGTPKEVKIYGQAGTVTVPNFIILNINYSHT